MKYDGKVGEVGIYGANMMGGVGILNVGAGDTKLSFDKSNPAERIRAARIVKDMIRRGYSLLIEVGPPEDRKFIRAIDFDEEVCEYIIADFDPMVGVANDFAQPRGPATFVPTPPVTGLQAMAGDGPGSTKFLDPNKKQAGERVADLPGEDDGQESQGAEAAQPQGEPAAGKSAKGRKVKRIPAETTRAVSVGKTAGG